MKVGACSSLLDDPQPPTPKKSTDRHDLGNRSQQGFRCETLKSFPNGQWPVAAVLPPQGCDAQNVGFGHDERSQQFVSVNLGGGFLCPKAPAAE